MKYAAIFMVLVLIASLVGVGYLYLTANVTVQAVGVTAVEASTQPALFEELARQVENRQVLGTASSSVPLGSVENYQFYTYTVRLRNNSFVTADMVEVQVTPMEGDVLQIEFETKKGDLYMEINAPDGTTIYCGNGKETTDFTVNIRESGVYTIVVEGRRAKGTIHVRCQG